MEGKTFAERLINWYTERKRDLPWRNTKDPYPVWLSEIILQQTRVEQGMPYWQRFVETYPSIQDLADAREENVLRLWQGLGYYSRARNLHATAKHVSNVLDGNFPSKYAEILKLKGIGPYTAAAIASICFDEPKPVVDGNVFRFASRYFGVEADISKASTRKVFEKILSEEISKAHPGTFNQAMMEYGATVCAPNPKCEDCTFRLDCFAYQHKKQKVLPVKTGKTKVRDRYFHYVVFKNQDSFLLKERVEKDVWGGLFDFYLIEGATSEGEVMEEIQKAFGISNLSLEETSEPFKHILSHQKIYATFYTVSISDDATKTVTKKSSLKPYSAEEVLNLPKPKLIVNYLQRIGIT
ncbi:A/G-specific adenine glycosylase [Ekhidna sp. MALMAid0563]|uniref:A/G-specific adenine glycosylase n=1 Tax=Ekhidna sp. MALMAid0563 TaxID=3143937 RepID=UPI0032E04A9F